MPSKNRETILHGAAQKGNVEVASVLIHLKADLNVQNTMEGAAPLHVAARHGNHTIVQTLIQSGCNVQITDKHGRTALHWAVSAGHVSVVKLLLQSGCNNIPDSNGETPLSILLQKITDYKNKPQTGTTQQFLQSLQNIQSELEQFFGFIANGAEPFILKTKKGEKENKGGKKKKSVF